MGVAAAAAAATLTAKVRTATKDKVLSIPAASSTPTSVIQIREVRLRLHKVHLRVRRRGVLLRVRRQEVLLRVSRRAVLLSRHREDHRMASSTGDSKARKERGKRVSKAQSKHNKMDKLLWSSSNFNRDKVRTEREIRYRRIKVRIRFPPHKKVSDIRNYPSFNLRKAGVKVEVLEWIGELDCFEELQETWVQISGIPPKWCAWFVFTQIASSFGLVTEVDWASMFKSFYEMVRVKVACRKPSMIPQERLYEIDKKIYKVYFFTEEVEQVPPEEDAPGDNEDQDDADEEFDGLDDQSEKDKKDKKSPEENGQNTTSDLNISKEDLHNAPKGSKTVRFFPDEVTNEIVSMDLQYNSERNMQQVASDALSTWQEVNHMMKPTCCDEKSICDDVKSTDCDENTEENTMEVIVSEEQKSKWERFMQGEENELSSSHCAQLLKSMELGSSDSESEEGEEMERIHLTKEMVENWSAKKNLMSTLRRCAEDEEAVKAEGNKKAKTEKQWGPVLPTRRSSRYVEDGKTTLEKAQERVEIKNLEKPNCKSTSNTLNSFAALDNEYLAQIAADIDIDLGQNIDSCFTNIETMKEQESMKIRDFISDNPEIMLPIDLDVCEQIPSDGTSQTDDKGLSTGKIWSRIQELEGMVMKMMKRWRLLCKQEAEEKLEQVVGALEEKTTRRSTVLPVEWWQNGETLGVPDQVQDPALEQSTLNSNAESETICNNPGLRDLPPEGVNLGSGDTVHQRLSS
ncbi:hypothetical protein EJB05_38665, partial [Eragrostis curvula]